jgi:hypothetical protein
MEGEESGLTVLMGIDKVARYRCGSCEVSTFVALQFLIISPRDLVSSQSGNAKREGNRSRDQLTFI